jgi:hypothetical protein
LFSSFFLVLSPLACTDLLDIDALSEVAQKGTSESMTATSCPDSKYDSEAEAKREASREAKSEDKPPLLLHSGPMLGDLPALGSPLTAVSLGPTSKRGKGSSSKGTKNKKRLLSAAAPANAAPIPPDCPPEFVCELSQTVMSDPVRSIYGNVFEFSVINQWLKHHGRVCPITGMYLFSA